MIANVFTPMLLAIPLSLGGSPAPPAPDDPLPTSTLAVVADFQRTDAGLRGALGRWERGDKALAARGAPQEVQLWALRQQRLLLRLRDRPSLAAAVLPRLRGGLGRGARDTLAAMTALERLLPRHPPKNAPRPRYGSPLPAGTLLRFYREGQRRFRVGWHVLAAVNFVESAFNKLRNDSYAGAQGPMQFIPATWRAYGLGGDIHDPHDAILGAANYLHANGAPGSYAGALYHYNPSSLYVDAVLRYARRIARSRRAFLTYYSWSVFVRTRSGGLRRLGGPG
jgi:soluble lytic murein transglycosylase-like protein